jgi:uncharacterized protein (TIGR02145 family)
MRKLLLTTAAVAAAIGLAGCGKTPPQELVSITYDTLTDTRDGQTYKTVKIGTQIWMAQNLNYQTESGSWCYKDSASYCKQYGRLYDWNTAKTVCPNGWRLPSREDWDSLGQAVGGEKVPFDDGKIDWGGAGKKLKSKSGWDNKKDGISGNGTDDFGFSALPGGYRDSGGYFDNAGNNGYWWSATEGSDDIAYGRSMNYYGDDVYEDDLYESGAFSARCVQDSE